MDPTVEALITQLHDQAEPSRPASEDMERRRRVLAHAESTLYRIDIGVWSFDSFPTPEDAAAESGECPEEIRQARTLLASRQLLAQQEDPVSGQPRLLPPRETPRQDAAQRIANKIALRMSLTIWCGNNFPTIEALVREFGCGSKTLCSAFKLLHDQGLVHKVSLLRQGRPGRERAWRPTDVVSQEPQGIIQRLESALRSGEVVGILPQKGDMARRCRVAPLVIRAGYAHLEREGLIAPGWPRHSRSPVWFATSSGVPRGLLPGKTRALAVTAAIIRDLPEWLIRHPNGTWSRILIPTKHALVRRFNADFDMVERALTLLVELQILEPAPVGAERYFPRPPVDLGAAHGVTFPDVRYARRPWAPARHPVQWLPLPLTDAHLYAHYPVRTPSQGRAGRGR